MAGATITGDGVAAMIRKDLALYVPYFKTLKIVLWAWQKNTRINIRSISRR